MIRISVMYPRNEGNSFDLDYYRNTHMSMVKEKFGELGLVSTELDSGLAGMGESPAPYHAIGYLLFNKIEDFQSAFEKAGNDILADIPNYTDIEPIIQISEYNKLY